MPPAKIRSPGQIRSMPSLRAAAAPSTAAGWRAVAALRYRPCATEVPTTAGRPRLEAVTVSALVWVGGMYGLREGLTLLTVPGSWTAVTPGRRPLIPGAATGGSAGPPARGGPVVRG